MSTYEIIFTLASIVFGVFCVWLFKLGQDITRLREQREADREVNDSLLTLIRELITVVRNLAQDSKEEHERLVDTIREANTRHDSKHETMNEKLTKVLAKHG